MAVRKLYLMLLVSRFVELIYWLSIETGNLPDFRKIPFKAELFVKDRWTGIPEIPKADQAQTMP
jgi:hypothetical protein